MASYIGAVQIGTDIDELLIGSTLYGICNTPIGGAAKVVTLNNFDSLQPGITIQVRFINGNTVHTGVTLQVGATQAVPVTGSCLCDADQVIAFTYETGSNINYWRSHHSIKGAMPITGGTFTGAVILNGAPVQDLQAATKKYVDDITANISGITGAMHFRGRITEITLPDAHDTETFNEYEAGDIILLGSKEYIYNKGLTAASSEWILLGDEGSYALKTNTTVVGSASNWNAGSVPTLGSDIEADDITSWDAGHTSNASVQNGVLVLTNSTLPSLRYTAKNIPNITNVGSVPSLTIGSQTVVVP